MNLLTAYQDQKIAPAHSAIKKYPRTSSIWYLSVYTIVSILICLFFAQAVRADNSISSTQPPYFSLCYNGIEGGNNGVQISGTANDSLVFVNARLISTTLDGVEQTAFSTDLYSTTDSSKCYPSATMGVPYPKVACTLRTYPLEAVSTNNAAEMAALQAAIWHFSDEFTLAETEPTYARYQEIVNKVNRLFDAGLCEQAEPWQLLLEPTSAIQYLEPLSSTSFKSKTHEFRLTLQRGATPAARQEISVSTDVGTLSWNGRTGSTIVVKTDFDGIVDIAVRNNEPSVANITLGTTVEISPGTRIDAGPYETKLVFGSSTTHLLQAEVAVEWRAGNEIAIRKFHDKNGDTLLNLDDELIGGQIEVCESGTATCDSYQIEPSGLLIVDVEPAKLYDICTTADNRYVASTAECISSVAASSVLDFGVVRLPALFIESYHDLNGNGLYDTNDSFLTGWPFQVERWLNGTWVSAYSGSTTNQGRYAVSSVGLQSLRITPQMPQIGENWYASSGESRVISLFDQKLYTATFGTSKPASVIVNQFWQKDSVAIDDAPTATNFCIKRTGPGEPQQQLIPTVGVTPLVQNDAGFYCYDNLINTITVKNLWPGNYAVQHYPPEGWGNSVFQPSSFTVSSGNEYRYVQASNNIRTGSFSGRAWNDVNRNGLRDPGEVGIPGVTVHLYANFDAEDAGTEANTAMLESTTTDDIGNYRFAGLLPGNYFIEFRPLDTYTVAAANTGGASADGYDSDADPTTKRTPIRLLTNGVSEANWDIGLYSNVGNYTFNHLINEQDADLLTSAVAVAPNTSVRFIYELQNNSDTPIIWENLSDETYGDLTGACSLPSEVLSFESARCELSRPVGTFPLGKSNMSTTSVAGLESSTDIVWYITAPPTGLSGVAWSDTDQDGVRDASEPGMSNVDVELFLGDGQATGRKTITDSTGAYSFDNLTAQLYYLEFTTPSGFFYTKPRIGGDITRDSDVNQMTDNIRTGRTNVIQLRDNEVNNSVDAGLLVLPPQLWAINLGSSGSISIGAPITYTINYVNHGYSQAYDVKIVETIPAGTAANLAQSTPGWVCAGGNVTAGTECTLSVGNVLGSSAVNAPVTFVVNVSADIDANTQIRNDIGIRDSGQSDPFPQPTGQGDGTIVPPDPDPTPNPNPTPNPSPTPNPTPKENNDAELFLPLIVDVQ